MVSYVMGVKRVETASEITRATGISNSSIMSGSQISMSSISMATTNSTGITEQGGNEDMENRLKRELERMEGRSREMVEMEKKGKEDLREELKGELKGMSDKIAQQNAKQDEKLERMMGMMMQMMKATAENKET